jgi:glycosyltransferase involved in cell wall biosynthesis
MSVLYLVTAPPPPFAGTDAVLQDVATLQQAVGGEIVHLTPRATSLRRFPKQLFGLHSVREIRQIERRCRINHVFFSFPYAFPVLRLLHNPIVYTVTASLDASKKPSASAQLRKLRRFVVSNPRDAAVLEAWGLPNHTIIPPGVDAVNLNPVALPLGRELTVLMASAPWNMRQFDSKGVDALLAAVAALPFLRLILLWRGVLADVLAARVARLGIGHRVEIVDRKVDIGDYLKRAHAAIVLAKDGGLVKSFPHSLVEALLAGKPVLVSDTIAMADYVRRHGCGVVVSAVSLDALTTAVTILRREYQALAGNAARIDRGMFSVAAMIEDYRALYGL